MKDLFKKWYFWIILILVVLLISLGVIVLTTKKENNTKQEKQDTEQNENVEKEESQEYREKDLTAEDIANEMKARELNIGRIVIYDEKTDMNNLLGRPNQYTSKISFEDITVEQTNLSLDPGYFTEEEINEPIGGTIEVFNNEEDMLARKKYIEAVTSGISTLQQYMYARDNVLLRIDYRITPSDADKYAEVFYNIIDSGIIVEK